MIASGTFEVTVEREPALHEEEGRKLGRARVEKRWSGALEGTSTVWMTTCEGPGGAASYVALERVSGTLDGRRGGFVLRHLGSMHPARGMSLDVSVVADSGWGELAGVGGEVEIRIEAGKHFYRMRYELAPQAG